ncbi:WD40-repeat-containing domain protein [Elsinoe ampelina]|uniref:WD40-repeat-containing domain protein n=1 Tax=Elsinoe ampelina TaxID=302913 RepID=A0A6A6GE64_9PEZI|nr:WD40-repeat-containing domain protein [Elsinoe ampelina]
MAIDPVLYPESHNLAHSDKSFYPLKIPVSHWQLRHYISHPDPDVLYYASGHDIFYLNTATRKRKLIATLPFEARCTASGFGYVCVGGEQDGHFAVVKLEESRTADVDAAIPLDYWQTTRGTPRAVSTKVERIGEEIVNSISIHQIHDVEAHLHDVVAVLTNNDRTVRIYSLIHAVEAAVIRLPDPMNHATISPDGKLLAAVGDVNTVFFYRRNMREDPPQIPKPHNRLNMTSATWEKAALHHLYVPGPDTQKGYFTTAWSQNGHLLAVGSEAGYISVFDMDIFEESGDEEVEATCLATVPSSRPNLMGNSWPGAVRSMLFAPDPWDLLIWAEDQGRICIGDIRRGLRCKQVIELDPKDVNLNRLDVEDLEAEEDPEDARRLLELEEEWIQRRLRDQDNYGDTRATDGQIRQRNQRLPRMLSRFYGSPESMLENDPQGLTTHEQRVLESLRTTRQREEELAQGAPPRSVNYTSASLFDSSARRRGETRATMSDDNANITSLPELSRATSTTHDEQTPGFALQNYQTQLRLSEQQQNPGTGSSAHDILQNHQRQLMLLEQQNRRRLLEARQATSSTANSTGSRPIPPHALRASDMRREDDEGPWRTISNAMTPARGPLFEGSSADRDASEERERIDHRRALIQQRERLRNLQRNLDASTSARAETADGSTGFQSRYELIRNANVDPRGFEAGWELLRRRSTRRTGAFTQLTGLEVGVRTAGLAISRDGRTVWAATEEGVFEIGLRFKERAMWPAVEML